MLKSLIKLAATHLTCTQPRRSKPRKLSVSDKLLMAGLYCLHMATAYLLMLAVMSYNVGFCVSCLLGLGAGFFMMTDSATGHSSTSSGGNSMSIAQAILGRGDACCSSEERT